MNKNLLHLIALIGSTSTSALYAQGIVVTPGAHLVGQNIGTNQLHLVVNDGGVINDGTVDLGNATTVQMVGNAGTNASSIGGLGTTNVQNLTIDKATNDVAMSSNIAVAGDLTFVSGNLLLNGFTLDLLNSGNLINETDLANASGQNDGEIKRQINLNAPNNVNPGNIGFELSSTVNMGNLTVWRRYEQFSVTPSEQTINRYFDVVADNGTGLNASVKVYYFVEDLNGANENDLYLWNTLDNGATWNFLGRDALNTSQQYVQKDGVQNIGRISVTTVNSPLPMDLVSFKATLVNNDGLLNWITVKEESGSHFDVQRSFDGSNFVAIGKVNCAPGATGAEQNYSFTDKDLFGGKHFYRLRMVDKDGKFSYSPIEILELPAYKNKILSVHPVPSMDKVYITLAYNTKAATTLTIFDISGKVVTQKPIQLEKGINKIELSLANFPDGAYQARLGLPEFGVIKLVRQ